MREHVWAVEYIEAGGLDGHFYRCHGCGLSRGPVPESGTGFAMAPFLAGRGAHRDEFSLDCEVAAAQIRQIQDWQRQALREAQVAVADGLPFPWVISRDGTSACWPLTPELTLVIGNTDLDRPGGRWEASLSLIAEYDTGDQGWVALGSDREITAVRRQVEAWVQQLRQTLEAL